MCVAYSGTVADARSKLATAITANSSMVAAFEGTNCENSGDSCVFLVAKTAGAGVSIALSVPRGADIDSTSVGNGENASLLYAADRNGSQRIYEYQAPNTAGASPLNTYDLNMQPRGLAVALQGSATARWLHVLAVEDGNDELRLYDSGSARERIVADQNDGLDQPYDLVWSANGCALVANRGSGEILAIGNISGPGNNTVELIADGFDELRGIALEGVGESANLLVVDSGFNVVVRLAPSAAGGDCF